MRALSGHGDEAGEPLERALALAERLQLPEVFVDALTSKAVVLNLGGRLAEARILLEAAAARAQAEQLYAGALRAQNNLGVVLEASDRYAEALESISLSLTLARRRGDRRWESLLRTGGIVELYLLGRWEEGLALAAEEEPLVASEIARGQLMTAALIHCEQGRLEPARALLLPAASLRESDNPQTRAGYAFVEARLLRAEGRPADALAAAERALAVQDELTITDTSVKTALVEATEAALDLGELDKAEALLAVPASLDPGELTPFLQAHAARLGARLDAARGKQERVDERFRAAAALFREFGLVFHLSVTQLEHGEWLVAQARADEAQPLVAEARETFERLQATPWLERSANFVLQQH
jgi:tetratricopeptide (TPR) repeat protein